MPRTTELKSEEAAVSSPLRRSCRIVAVNSPHLIKGRRLSATSENNGADEKNENKPTRARRAASVTKEDTEPKIEPAKPRTRRSSAAAEPPVVEEEKREPVTRSRRSSAAEEPSQESVKPVKTRRSSITDDAAKTPAGAKSAEGDGKSKTVTRRRSISKEPSDEAEESKPVTRSRRRSVDKDVDVEILEKKTTRQRRASMEKQEEPETKVVKLTPIKNKRRPSVTDNAVILEPIEEAETERKSVSPSPVDDTSSKHKVASAKRKHEPSKADLDLSIINECSFTEGNNSHTEEANSTSEISTGPLKESDQMKTETEKQKEEIKETFAASADSTTPPKEDKNVKEKSTTPKKSPRFRTSTDVIGTKAHTITEDQKMSPDLQHDVKMETSSDAILDKSQTSEQTTPEIPKIDIETPKSLDKPKQTSPETTMSPRKSPRILARKENANDQSQNSAMETLKETKTSTSTTEKIQSPTPGKETPKSLHQNIVDPKDSVLKGPPQKELNIEDDSAFLSKVSESKECHMKESATHGSSGSDDSFQFNISNSKSPEAEEEDVLNVSKISNSSDKENIAVNIDNDSIKSKAPPSVEKRVLGDLSLLNEKLTDLKQTTIAARVSNVFRPKNLEFSFVEPMDVDKTSVDLELTTSEKLDRIKLLSGATDDSIDESFKLNLSMTPVESSLTNNVFDTPKKDIEISKDQLEASSEKVIPTSNTVDSDELIVDVSEASCVTPAVESEDASNISISKEPVVKMKEESIEQAIPDATNNSNMSTILEEDDNKPDEQNGSKIVQDQSGDEKTVMSPDYDFQLPSDESGSEVDNKFFERPSSPSREESEASNVEKENKDLVNEDKELKPSDEEIFDKLPVEQPEESSRTIELIEPEEINDVEKENAELEESAKTPNQDSSITENKENIVETGESEMVVNQEPDETSEKPLSEGKDTNIEQKHEKSTAMDEIKIEYSKGEKESITEENKTINNIVEKKEIADNPNVVPENISKNENHTVTDSEEKSNDTKFQMDVQDEITIEEKEGTFETKSDDLKTEEISDDNSPPKMTNVKTSNDVQTEQSPESVEIPLDIELIKTSDESMSTEVPTKANDESSQCSIDTIVDIEGVSIVDAESEIVKIDSPTNKDYDYEEMERSFQDIVKDDEVKPKEKSESPMFRPTSETKKSKKARKSKQKGFDDSKSDINEKLVEQLSVETNSPQPQKLKKGNLRLDNESSTEDILLDLASSRTTKKSKKNTKNDATADETDETMADTDQKALSDVDNASSRTPKKSKENTKNDATADETDETMADTEQNALSDVDNASSRTPKKSKENTKNDAAADETDETMADTEQNALSDVDNASDKELFDQHSFEMKPSKNEKKFNRIEAENVESNLEETDINIDTKSTKKTPKKTKKRAKIITLTDESTESVPTEELTSDEVQSTDNFSKTNKKSKKTEKSLNHDNDRIVEGAEEPKTKKKKNKKSKSQNSNNTSEKTHDNPPLEGFRHPKLDEIIDKMLLETKKQNEHVTEEQDSSEKEYASEEEEEESGEENPYIDTMAEEGEEDTPSEGSNDIIDDGESINTTESERETDEDYDDDDSFICDEEVVDLLSGDDEDDLGDEKIKKKKKSRIINVEECNSDVIRIERKKKSVEPKKRSRIISVSSSSEDENDESLKEAVQVLEHAPPVELEDKEPSEKPRKRTSSITIIENINVNDIKDTVLSQRIHHLVDSFCTTIPRQGDISMNLSLEYADIDEEPPTKISKQKSPRSSFVQTSPKETKTKRLSDVKKRSSSGDKTVAPAKKQKLSLSLNDFEDLPDDQEESNKRKRLSKSSEDISIKKSKKKKKSVKKVRDMEEDSEASKKKRTYSENNLRSKTFSLINQLITDVKNRPKRAVKPSTSKVDSSIDDSWDVEVADVTPSTSIVSKTEIEKYKFTKMHPNDFRNRMLYDPNRVKRIETKTLLKKKGAYF